ncbi:MAG: hypothetical protein D6717_07990 [Gammaproteobacteria bacterium]|nr:MAG: hypothetical protein D6717_07990 [Gammaproteobacteria bacterium]
MDAGVPRLVLTPRDATAAPAEEALRLWCRETGLAGAPLGDHYLRAGEDFLRLLVFLGCSPTVSFEMPDEAAIGSGSFYHVAITCLPAPTLRADRMTLTPRCPACREALQEWRELWPPGSPAVEAECPSCAAGLRPEVLNWRRSAGVGSAFIEVLGIHAGTVQPAPALFERLKTVSGLEWQHFFVSELPVDPSLH